MSPCKNLKPIKLLNKKLLESSAKHKQSTYIWDISDITSSIFIYIDFNDLMEFNAVCKRWNQLTNPIIHRSIKLDSGKSIINKFHDDRFNNQDSKTNAEAEVELCIYNNYKFAKFVKEFNLSENLEIKNYLKIFNNFKFITLLKIERLSLCEDKFFSIINSLSKLNELNLKYIEVKSSIGKRIYTEAVKLPQTLTKLTMEYINLINSPSLFVETLNSHTKLIEFSYKTYDQNGFLNPFYKHYPSLKIFEYNHQQLESPELLLKLFESNPQLLTLSLVLKCWNNTISTHISNHLINLQSFNLTDLPDYSQDRSPIYIKLLKFNNIKKLKLSWDRLSSCSLNSILFNCPQLEDLSLKYCRNYLSEDSYTTLNYYKLLNLKNLEIKCCNISLNSLNNILLNSKNLIKLIIQLPINWKLWLKLISKNCYNIKKLTINPPYQLYGPERDNYYLEICELEFLKNNSSYKSVLTQLTLINFNFNLVNINYFKSFKMLKVIKFPWQLKLNNRGNFSEVGDLNNDLLWPGYKLKVKDYKYNIDIELIKL